VATKTYRCVEHDTRLEVEGTIRRLTVRPPRSPANPHQSIPPYCVLYTVQDPQPGNYGPCKVIQEA